MNKQIPLSVPNLNMEIVENLRECIETGWVSTGGRFITEFESKTAKYLNVSEAVSTQSGTGGLHLALKVLGVGNGDEVIVPTLTFVAAVNPVRYVGADPVFMDCDDSLCMDVEKLKTFLEEECYIKEIGKDKKQLVNKTTGNIVKAILPVHIFGNMADMEVIMDLSLKYGLKVVEDATEALGSHIKAGRYKGKFAGTIGDIGVFSFNANKIITTGGGGMVVANNKKLLDDIRHLSITAKTDSLYFVHDKVGFNYRMLNTQAALGVSQIDELEKFIQIKKSNFNQYVSCLETMEGFNGKGIRILPFNDDARSNYWFYSLLVDKDLENENYINRDELMNKLIDNGIQCRPIWKLIHTLEPYNKFQSYKIEKADYYEKHILNVPCSTSLTREDVIYIMKIISEIIK